jgi:hypothetical protein
VIGKPLRTQDDELSAQASHDRVRGRQVVDGRVAGSDTWAVTTTRLALTRSQILGFRRQVAALDERLPSGAVSLRKAAWAGLQDSMPRAALASIHARVERAGPSSWEDPSLVQVWGPRFSAYVVAAPDRPVFTLGRLPDVARP